MPQVIVAGAGFGGIAVAVTLRRELGEGIVTLIDRRQDFVMGLRKSWAALGIGELEPGVRRLADIDGINLVQGDISAVEPAARGVEVDGRRYAGDALVLALGAEHVPQQVPGLAEHGINVWSRDEASRARSAIEGLGDNGRLVIGVFGMPYSCPPGPYEFALLARDHLPAGINITAFTPAPMALSVAGAVESAKLEALLAKRDITFLPKHKAAAVRKGVVEIEDGRELPFDVLLGVPPHRCPPALVAAGLAESGGWIKPDPRTLEVAGHEGVYAIGDCTAIPLANGMPLPKAGVFAHAQGEVVGARIAARLRGEQPSATFDGLGVCYLETGGGEAAKTYGSFLADPPQVRVSSPAAETLEEKHEFERSRLAAWFGG